MDYENQISDIANFIAGELLTYAQSLAGDCQIVFNPQDLWMQSAQDSQRPMLYICWMGCTPWSSNANISAATHRVSNDWCVRVKQGRGFSAQRGSTLSKPVGNAGNFYNVVSMVANKCRAMLGITQDTIIDFKGIKPVKLGGQIIDCFDVEFSTKNDLPTIINQPDN